MSERLGAYEIVRKLAAGGMAEVLLAKYHGIGGFARLVCLKRILGHLQHQDDFLKMFQDEARISANLVHPNIAQIYDIAKDGPHVFIAMEYVRGQDLRRVYNQEAESGKTIDLAIAAYIMMQVALGLDYAHRQVGLDGMPLHLVHRDISPQNIIITYEGGVKIVDFGVAKATGKLLETRSGVLKGKYSYMSPEQASGDFVDGRSDIFAMGITLYEIITGTRLFKRDNELETLHAVVACNVPSPKTVNSAVDHELDTIIMQALAYEADERYQSAKAFATALDQYIWQRRIRVNAMVLANYMQKLFATKITDEALFGEPPWGEYATNSRLLQPGKQTTAEPVVESTTTSDQAASTPVFAASKMWPEDDEALENTLSRAVNPHETTYGDWAPLPEEAATRLRPLTTVKPLRHRRQGLLTWRRLVILLILLGLSGSLWRYYYLKSVPLAATTDQSSPAIAAAPTAAIALLSLNAPVTMEVNVGQQFLGETPIVRLPVAAGRYRLRLANHRLGWQTRLSVNLAADQETILQVPNERGQLKITATPWAWVQVGSQAAQETPVQLMLYDGEYSITIECPNGGRKNLSLTVHAKQQTVYAHLCH